VALATGAARSDIPPKIKSRTTRTGGKSRSKTSEQGGKTTGNRARAPWGECQRQATALKKAEKTSRLNKFGNVRTKRGKKLTNILRKKVTGC